MLPADRPQEPESLSPFLAELHADTPAGRIKAHIEWLRACGADLTADALEATCQERDAARADVDASERDLVDEHLRYLSACQERDTLRRALASLPLACRNPRWTPTQKRDGLSWSRSSCGTCPHCAARAVLREVPANPSTP